MIINLVHSRFYLKIGKWVHSDAPLLSTLYNWISRDVFDFDYDQILRPHNKRPEPKNAWLDASLKSERLYPHFINNLGVKIKKEEIWLRGDSTMVVMF